MELFKNWGLNTPINLPSIKKSRRDLTHPSSRSKSITIQLLKDLRRFGEFTVVRAAKSTTISKPSVPRAGRTALQKGRDFDTGPII
jgi:hypothetical protein